MVNTNQQLGFSLIELLVASVILSILVSIAAPAFTQLIAEQRLRQVSTELRLSLTLARSEAVKRNSSIVLVPRSDDWSNGWCLEADDAASDCSVNPINEYVVDSSVSIPSGPGSITFTAWGRPSASCPKFQINTKDGECKVCVYVETDGLVTSSAGTCGSDCSDAATEFAWSAACE